ncbi:MAG: ABC transporter ATP-binding protein, partial [Planctomycetota bacterium]
RLGFMPDSFGTYRNTNCAEYLDFYARSHGLVGRQRTARMRRVMDFTGLRALADKPIRGLSKGMKQRLCLGRALIHDPAVLILDEPAAGLDPRARIELRRMIRELASDDKTILISSHILTELAEMCDRIGIIEQGQLLATGTVDEVRGNTTQTRHIAIEFAGPANELKQLLDAPADIAAGLIEDVTIKDNWAKFRFKGDRDDQTKLLQEIIRTEMPVLQFRCEDQSLEDVFLSVTKGLVQ